MCLISNSHSIVHKFASWIRREVVAAVHMNILTGRVIIIVCIHVDNSILEVLSTSAQVVPEKFNDLHADLLRTVEITRIWFFN